MEHDSESLIAWERGIPNYDVTRGPPVALTVPQYTPFQFYSDQNNRKREFRNTKSENNSDDEELRNPAEKKIYKERGLVNQKERSTECNHKQKEVKDLITAEKEKLPNDRNSIDDEKTKMEEYLEKRRKNNASAKKSREARRLRELETQIRASYLENENSKLRTIVSALRNENSQLRDLLIV